MLKKFVAICSAIMVATAASPLSAKPVRDAGRQQHAAQPKQEIDPRVMAVFAQFPEGGPAMTEALNALLAQDLGLARDIVERARVGTRGQKIAAGKALAYAQRELCKDSQSEVCRSLAAIIATADAETAASFQAALVALSDTNSSSYGRGALGAVSGGGGSLGGGGSVGVVVSPN